MHPEGKGHQFSSLILEENRDFWAAHRHLGHGIAKGRSQSPEDSGLRFPGAGRRFPRAGAKLPGSRTEIPRNRAEIPGSSGLPRSKAEILGTWPELPGDQGRDLLSKERKEGGKEPRKCWDAAFPGKREVWSREWLSREWLSQECSKKPAKTRARRRETPPKINQLKGKKRTEKSGGKSQFSFCSGSLGAPASAARRREVFLPFLGAPGCHTHGVCSRRANRL